MASRPDPRSRDCSACHVGIYPRLGEHVFEEVLFRGTPEGDTVAIKNYYCERCSTLRFVEKSHRPHKKKSKD